MEIVTFGSAQPFARTQGTCGLAPLASQSTMNRGGTSTSRTLDGWNCGLGLDMTDLRFARRPKWTPLANPIRIARRRVKVCVVRTTGPRRLDLDASSTLRPWDDNGGHPLNSNEAAFDS
jgi:hypothetical protein